MLLQMFIRAVQRQQRAPLQVPEEHAVPSVLRKQRRKLDKMSVNLSAF